MDTVAFIATTLRWYDPKGKPQTSAGRIGHYDFGLWLERLWVGRQGCGKAPQRIGVRMGTVVRVCFRVRNGRAMKRRRTGIGMTPDKNDQRVGESTECEGRANSGMRNWKPIKRICIGIGRVESCPDEIIFSERCFAQKALQPHRVKRPGILEEEFLGLR